MKVTGLFVFVVVCSVSISISQTCYWISVGAGGLSWVDTALVCFGMDGRRT